MFPIGAEHASRSNTDRLVGGNADYIKWKYCFLVKKHCFQDIRSVAECLLGGFNCDFTTLASCTSGKFPLLVRLDLVQSTPRSDSRRQEEANGNQANLPKGLHPIRKTRLPQVLMWALHWWLRSLSVVAHVDNICAISARPGPPSLKESEVSSGCIPGIRLGHCVR